MSESAPRWLLRNPALTPSRDRGAFFRDLEFEFYAQTRRSLIEFLVADICIDVKILIYSSVCTRSPLRNFGSNQVLFGGMISPASETAIS